MFYLVSADMSQNTSNSPAAAADDEAVAASTTKPPEEWVTGDEPATGAQLSYLQTLAREVDEELPESLTKAHASELIDEYRQRSPRVES
ncbi:hypothetical protein GCM10022223_28230 [Kineosporia mesophila]|uniref:DUF3072 domain-containing protein n=2 Tax=Kineosporia mesophila TaxID=566012 RepID=A0ABP6ZKL4_9ACTN